MTLHRRLLLPSLSHLAILLVYQVDILRRNMQLHVSILRGPIGDYWTIESEYGN